MLKIRQFGKAVLRMIGNERLLSTAHSCLWAWYAVHPPNREEQKIIQDLVARYVPPGAVCVDIGAYAGIWTYALARKIGNNGRVFAIEAYPYHAEVLQRTLSIWRADNVGLYNVALSDRTGESTLVLRDTDGTRLAGKVHLRGAAEQAPPESISVRSTTLDNLTQSEPDLRRVSFIKVDVEGAELFVFRGAQELLRNAHPIIYCEIVDQYCNRYGHRAEDVFDFLAAMGYSHRQVTDIDFLFMAAHH